MATAIIPALGRDTAGSSLFDFAANLVRTQAALLEALPESDGYDGLLKLAVDADVSDAEIGRTARELILGYLQDVGEFRGENLAEISR